MKTSLFLFVMILALNFSAQNSCCEKPASTEAFAMLTQDKNFVATHLDPTPFTLTKLAGKEISFKVEGGKEGHAYEIKSEKPTNNYIIVVHEWWGLNDYIRQESEQIFNTVGNTNVIAIDLYDHQVAASRDSAAVFMQSVKKERAEAIISGLLRYIGPKANIATIGWCFGGGWSMQISLLAAKQSKACVMYYGAPEEKMERIKTLNSPVFFVFAEQDQWINKEMVTKFEANMKTAGKSLTVKSYDADHAFANPSNPQYKKEFTEDAHKRATDFIKTSLL